MLLFWAVFTVGFFFGAILGYIIFAAKTPEEENIKINRKDYLNSQSNLIETGTNLNLESTMFSKTHSQ